MPHPARRRGSAALAVTLMLLLMCSLGALYVNRGVLFEQRTAVNQMQAASVESVAEAGLEWATGMLNTPYDLDNACRLQATANEGFRKRYVLTRYSAASNPSSDVIPATNVYPGCKLTGTELQCGCPAVPANGTAAPDLGAQRLPGFTVAFEAVAADPEAVRVTVYACLAQAATCTPQSHAQADGRARVSAVIKLRPVLRAMPSAPLTCGTSCTVGGSFNIENEDVATNGVLVNAGTTITTANGVTLDTLPGLPPANALVGNDASLSALSSSDADCSRSAMFNAYFGSTIEQYRVLPTTKQLSCGSAADCRSKLNTAYAEGWRSFYFASDLHLSGNDTYGSANDPITIVTPNAIDINGDNEFWGLIFSNSATWNDLGTGTATIHGAQVSCAAYRNNGNGTITYDRDVLKNARRLTGLMVRVPGSWRDFRVSTDTLP